MNGDPRKNESHSHLKDQTPMLITFEGIDQSGKSTQAKRLAEHLRKDGPTEKDPLLVREPGGTGLSERVREVLLDRSISLSSMSEMLLFSAARVDLVEKKIKPALEKRRVVICDRFYDSTIAYQGAGREVESYGWVESFQQKVIGGLEPDRTFLLDIPLDVAYERRSEKEDRMESEGAHFQRKVADAYREIASQNERRIRVIDGTKAPDQIQAKIQGEIRRMIISREEGERKRRAT